jgi:hypothetical protein
MLICTNNIAGSALWTNIPHVPAVRPWASDNALDSWRLQLHSLSKSDICPQTLQRIREIPDDCLELLDGLLQIDMEKRWTARDCLSCSFLNR